MKVRKSTFIKLGWATFALLGSFGLVFGLAAFNRTPLFIDFNNPKGSISYYDATPQETKWNVSNDTTPFVTQGKTDFINQTNSENKFNYASLVIDGASHQILDKSFNQSGYQGLINWIWTNDWYDNPSHVNPTSPVSTYDPNKVGSANGSKPSTDNANDFWLTYENLANHGYQSLVLPGYMHENGLSNFKIKSPSVYAKDGYILLDANDPDDKNVASVIFRTDEAAFMTGIATCQYLNDNFDEYKSGGLRVGTFGGVAIPSVTIYMGGFEYGIQVWNDNIETIAQANGWDNPDEHKVNIINLGSKDSWFSNSFAIGDGKSLAKALLQRGADAILPVAGPQTVDTVRQIKASNSSCIVLGVDTAQEDDPSTNDTSKYTDKLGNNQIVKFSATKNIADITSQILSLGMAQWPNDRNEPPSTAGLTVNVGSFGYLTVGSTDNNGITPTENSFPYLVEFIESATGVIPPPISDQTTYDYILHHLEEFQATGSSETVDFFDANHISNPDLMRFRF